MLLAALVPTIGKEESFPGIEYDSEEADRVESRAIADKVVMLLLLFVTTRRVRAVKK